MCVVLSVCMCTLCMQVPKEAKGQQSPEAGITGSYEPSVVGAGTQSKFSVRAAKALNCGAISPAPALNMCLVLS